MKKLIALFILAAFALSPLEVSAAEEFDLTVPCGLSEEELAAGLRDELIAFAPEFIAAEQKYGVNAVFLAAVAALESGWGKSCFRPNNIFGWNGKDFESKAECIDFVASKIAEHYLSEGGKYYHGKTVSGVNICYNGSDFWERKVTEIMAMITRGSKAAQCVSDVPAEVVFIG
ncbi:MAG: glucosaminidase domain-containing protein [Oscillospiraceae bacterium]|nr:glucosaminidase domain-containing protein [Oscillospiraceae bacterium]